MAEHRLGKILSLRSAITSCSFWAYIKNYFIQNIWKKNTTKYREHWTTKMYDLFLCKTSKMCLNIYSKTGTQSFQWAA